MSQQQKGEVLLEAWHVIQVWQELYKYCQTVNRKSMKTWNKPHKKIYFSFNFWSGPTNSPVDTIGLCAIEL